MNDVNAAVSFQPPFGYKLLAYTSLATSPLAAFGAVTGKQWLAHYKPSRFGRSSPMNAAKQDTENLLALRNGILRLSWIPCRPFFSSPFYSLESPLQQISGQGGLGSG